MPYALDILTVDMLRDYLFQQFQVDVTAISMGDMLLYADFLPDKQAVEHSSLHALIGQVMRESDDRIDETAAAAAAGEGAAGEEDDDDDDEEEEGRGLGSGVLQKEQSAPAGKSADEEGETKQDAEDRVTAESDETADEKEMRVVGRPQQGTVRNALSFLEGKDVVVLDVIASVSGQEIGATTVMEGGDGEDRYEIKLPPVVVKVASKHPSTSIRKAAMEVKTPSLADKVKTLCNNYVMKK